jgi:hypothetical protein
MTLFSALTNIVMARGTRKDLQKLIAGRNIGGRVRSQRCAKHVVPAGAGAGQEVDGSGWEGRVNTKRWRIVLVIVTAHKLGATLQR